MNAVESVDGDLGFTYRQRKNGEVEILHHGQSAAILRGARAVEFLAAIAAGDGGQAQQLMARLTGNYRRGHERAAKEHPRNR